MISTNKKSENKCVTYYACISYFMLNVDRSLCLFKDKTILSLLVCHRLAYSQTYSSTVRYTPFLPSLFDINAQEV